MIRATPQPIAQALPRFSSTTMKLRQSRSKKGHTWASIHKSHDMHRCDLTVFSRKCGSASSTYNTKVLRDLCNPAASATGYHQDLLKMMKAGNCPYATGWKSGLPKYMNWPPAALHVYVGGGSNHHTKCTCATCRQSVSAEQQLTSPSAHIGTDTE